MIAVGTDCCQRTETSISTGGWDHLSSELPCRGAFLSP